MTPPSFLLVVPCTAPLPRPPPPPPHCMTLTPALLYQLHRAWLLNPDPLSRFTLRPVKHGNCVFMSCLGLCLWVARLVSRNLVLTSATLWSGVTCIHTSPNLVVALSSDLIVTHSATYNPRSPAFCHKIYIYDIGRFVVVKAREVTA